MGMHEDADKESECSAKTSMQTQDVACILTANDTTSSLDTKSCHETGSPSKRSLKSDITKCHNTFKTMNATSVLDTLDMDEETHPLILQQKNVNQDMKHHSPT